MSKVRVGEFDDEHPDAGGGKMATDHPDDTVTIPRPQYEALVALRPIVAEVAYARAPLNDRTYREARAALAALRAAGIDLEDKP